jgi:hypothetical protein
MNKIVKKKKKKKLHHFLIIPISIITLMVVMSLCLNSQVDIHSDTYKLVGDEINKLMAHDFSSLTNNSNNNNPNEAEYNNTYNTYNNYDNNYDNYEYKHTGNNKNINTNCGTNNNINTSVNYEILEYGKFGSQTSKTFYSYVDKSKNKTIIVIFAGKKPVNCNIKITKIVKNCTGLTVYVNESMDNGTMLITSPYIVVSVNGSYNDVKFIEKR